MTFSEVLAEALARPTLGTVLQAWRRAAGQSILDLAMGLGVPLDTARGFEADTLLPTADQVFSIADILETPPHRVLRHVQATARTILQRALAAGAAAPELPVALQAAIARHGQTVSEALAQVRIQAAAEQDGWALAMAADLQLEGEAAWEAEGALEGPSLDDIDDAIAHDLVLDQPGSTAFFLAYPPSVWNGCLTQGIIMAN